MPYLKDLLLERCIKHALEVLEREKSPAAWHEFANLIKQRSPEQVARMEREKGLA